MSLVQGFPRFTQARSVEPKNGSLQRVNAAVKVTEDLYYAAIYRGAMRVFRANELADATEHKLEVMYRTYSMLSDEAEAHTSRRLEWIVIVLILIEVVYGTIDVVERLLK